MRQKLKLRSTKPAVRTLMSDSEGHALRAWRKLYNLQVETANQRRRGLLKRKRESAAASRSPLDSFIQYDSNVRVLHAAHSTALRAVHAALTSSLRASLSLAGVISASVVHPKSLDSDARLPAGTAAGARPQLAIPSVPSDRPKKKSTHAAMSSPLE